MDQAGAAAYVNAQTACALLEMEAMKAANKERESQGFALAYGEEAFMAVIEKYGIHHNGVITILNEWAR